MEQLAYGYATIVLVAGTKYKVTTKRPDTGKWWTYGSVKVMSRDGKSPFASVGLRKTPELMAIINNAKDGDYINFSIYEDDKTRPTPHEKAKQDGYQPDTVPLEDDIPW